MGEEVKKKSTQPSDAVNNTWWLLLFLGKGIICSTIGKITCEKCSKSRMGEEVKKKLTQPTDAVNSTWWLLLFLGKGIICSTIGKITCKKCSKSRMGEEVKKKKKPQPSGAVTAPDGWAYSL